MKNNLTKSDKSFDDYRRPYTGVPAVVLGATGFIGRWVARNLCRAGAKLFLPARDRSEAQKIFEEYGIEGEIFELNLLKTVEVREFFQQIRPAVTFNLAGYGVNPAERSDDAADEINARLIETVCAAIARAASDSGWTGQQIIHTGTAMEYGSASGNLSEDSAPQPTTLYGKSKLAGTLNLTRGCQKYQIKGITARLFAVYGAGELPARLLPTLIKAAGVGQEPIQLTAGLQKRDFTYVEDAAEGLLRLGLASAQKGEVVNLATGKLTSIRNFTKTAAGLLGIAAGRLNFGALPTRPEEMKHQPVTIERLRRLTDWTPPTTIAEGVGKTLSFGQKAAGRTSGCGS